MNLLRPIFFWTCFGISMLRNESGRRGMDAATATAAAVTKTLFIAFAEGWMGKKYSN